MKDYFELIARVTELLDDIQAYFREELPPGIMKEVDTVLGECQCMIRELEGE